MLEVNSVDFIEGIEFGTIDVKDRKDLSVPPAINAWICGTIV